MNEVTIQLAPWSTEREDPGECLRRIRGVTRVVVDSYKRIVAVAFERRHVDTFALVAALGDAGFQVQQQSLMVAVTGRQCAGCVLHVEGALADVPGVIDARVDLGQGTATLQLTRPAPDGETIANALLSAGYARHP